MLWRPRNFIYWGTCYPSSSASLSLWTGNWKNLFNVNSRRVRNLFNIGIHNKNSCLCCVFLPFMLHIKFYGSLCYLKHWFLPKLLSYLLKELCPPLRPGPSSFSWGASSCRAARSESAWARPWWGSCIVGARWAWWQPSPSPGHRWDKTQVIYAITALLSTPN